MIQVIRAVNFILTLLDGSMFREYHHMKSLISLHVAKCSSDILSAKSLCFIQTKGMERSTRTMVKKLSSPMDFCASSLPLHTWSWLFTWVPFACVRLCFDCSISDGFIFLAKLSSDISHAKSPEFIPFKSMKKRLVDHTLSSSMDRCASSLSWRTIVYGTGCSPEFSFHVHYLWFDYNIRAFNIHACFSHFSQVEFRYLAR